MFHHCFLPWALASHLSSVHTGSSYTLGSQLGTRLPMSGKHLYSSERCSTDLNAAKQGHRQQMWWVQDMLVRETLFPGLWSVIHLKWWSCNSSNSGRYWYTNWTVLLLFVLLPELLNWIIASQLVVPYCLFFMQTVYVSSWSRAILGTALIFL